MPQSMKVPLTREITVRNCDNNPTTNDNLVNVENLERCFNERIDRKMGNILKTVEHGLQNAYLTAIDSNKGRKIEITNRSKNASFGRDATSVMANSERGEHKKSSAPFQNVS